MRARAALVALLLAVSTGHPSRLVAQVSPGPLARPHAALEGALQCPQCHAPANAMSARCSTCHRDIAWLAERKRGLHGTDQARSQPCASCHPDHAGRDFALVRWPGGRATAFDHRQTGWELVQSHRQVACAKCHTTEHRTGAAAVLAAGGRSNWTGLEPSCASCHRDPHRTALGDRCTTCHDAGRWTATPGFSHDTTRYPLTGRHQAVGCDRCHADARVAVRRDQTGRPIPVYRPVDARSCASCHTDPHGGRLGASCAGCHDTRAFGRISGKGFDHTGTGFALRGAHGRAACSGCHREFSSPAGRRPPSGTCAGCHSPDPHAGTATLAGKPADCAACHVETGFRPATLAPARHAETTGFALDGGHATVACAACHRTAGRTGVRGPGTAGTVLHPPARCAGCHENVHGSELAGRTDGGACAGCHTTAGWRPSAFTGTEHARTGLPLEGRHAEARCAACHAGPASRPGAGPGVRLKGLPTTCAGCHRDPHGGRFTDRGVRPVPGGCAMCHTVDGFAPAPVGRSAHERLGFRLGGAHLAVPCADCHRTIAGSATRRNPALLRDSAGPARSLEVPADCAGCHARDNPHGTQFESRADGGRCGTCHGDTSFRPASGFDHTRDTRFVLDGRHAATPCDRCHRPEPGVPGARVRYGLPGRRCEDCHAKR